MQQLYADVVANADLIIVDNLSTLCRGLKENDADKSFRVPVQQWALAQRRAGKSVLFIHHGGKSGQQRGTSRKEHVLDTVIRLLHPPDYRPIGLSLELHVKSAEAFMVSVPMPLRPRLSATNGQIGEIDGDDIESIRG